MKIRVGIDVACRAAHQASCADELGVFAWSGHRFRTDPADLEALWAKLPSGADEVMVIIEPTRNAWVPLAAWFRRRGATVVVVPPEQSADLRDYYNKHAKSDRLDSKSLARLPLLLVRRGFSEDGSSAFDLGHDVVDGLGPDEGFGVVVPV